MTTRLKIDLSEGVLEVEGSESFVKAIYTDFKAHFISEEAAETSLVPRRTRKPRKSSKTKAASKAPAKEEKTAVIEASEPAPAPLQEEPPAAQPQPESPQPKPAPQKPIYTYLDNLDLSANGGRPSLVEFMDAKFPITNEERNLVFLHYLQNMRHLKSITTDHVYTCYRAARIRAPLDLEASLQSTARQNRWIKISKSGNLSVTPAGKLYVEKQLPKKVKS